MKIKVYYLSVLLAVLPTLAACSKDDKQEEKRDTGVEYMNNIDLPQAGTDVPSIKNNTHSDLNEKDIACVEAGNRMSYKLFELVSNKNLKGGNGIISPVSLETALGMFSLAGGDDDTKAYCNALHFPSLTRQELSEYYSRLQKLLETAGSYKRFFPANTLWVSKKEKDCFIQKYADDLKKYYDASMVFANLENPETIGLFNEWVERKSYGKIKNLLQKDMASRTLKFILGNVVYFYAPWDTPFDIQQTKPMPFTNSDGKTIDVSTMNNVVTTKYAKAENYEAISLEAGEKFDLLIVLPNKGVKLDPGIMTRNDPSKLIEKGKHVMATISLPKIKIEGKACNLTPYLREMGLSKFLDMKLGNMFTDNKYFNIDVLQKAMSGWDENGLEAAAATTISGNPGPLDEIDKIDFKVNRPFFYLIRHAQSGKILFIGQVSKLSK